MLQWYTSPKSGVKINVLHQPNDFKISFGGTVPEIGPSRCTDTVRLGREGDAVLWSLAASVYTKGHLTMYTVHDSWTRPLLRAGSRAAPGKITVSGAPNRLNYCVIVYT